LVGAISCSRERAEYIGDLLRNLGLNAFLKLEEEDPQYGAVKGIVESLGAGLGLVAVILVSLITYRLPMRGEDWWKCAEERIRARRSPESGISELLEAVKAFAKTCGGGLAPKRIARLNKVANSAQMRALLGSLARDPLGYPRQIHKLWKALSEALSQPPNAKTIVFSLKMAYYAYRAAGGDPRELSGVSIPMPIDSRIACLTYSSRLCDVISGDYRVLVSRPRSAQEIWALVSNVSGISTIHLDALAWRLGWIPRDSPSLDEARRRGYKLLAKYADSELAFKLCNELIARLCRNRRGRAT
jgi:DNA-(apurinic or apyrimidinic site) lyase